MPFKGDTIKLKKLICRIEVGFYCGNETKVEHQLILFRKLVYLYKIFRYITHILDFLLNIKLQVPNNKIK